MVHSCSSINRIPTVAGLLHDRRLPVELILHLSNQLLNHVLDGYEAGGASVFIHYYCQRGTCTLKAPEHNLDAGGLGDETDWSHRAAHGFFWTCPVEVLDVDIADGVVHSFLVHGVPAVSYTHLTLPTNREV